MDTYQIKYQFTLSNNRKINIDLTIDEKRLLLVNPLPDNLPSWTKLEFHQCSNCPLSVSKHPHCPLATQLLSIVTYFTGILSHERVHLQVSLPIRTVSGETSAQEAIGSLMGIVSAGSGCPHTAFFRPMLRFHLPLAEIDETAYRAASMYMLGLYFKHKHGESTEWNMQGLIKAYQAIKEVNYAMAKRLRAACSEDAAVNAVVILDMFAQNLSDFVEESLTDLEYLFEPLLDTKP